MEGEKKRKCCVSNTLGFLTFFSLVLGFFSRHLLLLFILCPLIQFSLDSFSLSFYCILAPSKSNRGTSWVGLLFILYSLHFDPSSPYVVLLFDVFHCHENVTRMITKCSLFAVLKEWKWKEIVSQDDPFSFTSSILFTSKDSLNRRRSLNDGKSTTTWHTDWQGVPTASPFFVIFPLSRIDETKERKSTWFHATTESVLEPAATRI